eukprot:5647194-Pyramimonas_sp.AAC.1
MTSEQLLAQQHFTVNTNSLYDGDLNKLTRLASAGEHYALQQQRNVTSGELLAAAAIGAQQNALLQKWPSTNGGKAERKTHTLPAAVFDGSKM